MLPWIALATARTPEGETLRLMRRGAEFSIRLGDGNELMNSRLGGSEEALARLALERCAPTASPRILIGGLGMGFTLRAAQERAPADARLVVSEIVPDLVDWATRQMEPVFGTCLADPRVEIRIEDVARSVGKAAGTYDAILLDVDNGPDGLTRDANDALYGEAGLRAAYRALAPGGVLAIWSAAPDRTFADRLARCGFAVTTHRVRAGRGGRGSRHTVWTATRRAA